MYKELCADGASLFKHNNQRPGQLYWSLDGLSFSTSAAVLCWYLQCLDGSVVSELFAKWPALLCTRVNVGSLCLLTRTSAMLVSLWQVISSLTYTFFTVFCSTFKTEHGNVRLSVGMNWFVSNIYVCRGYVSEQLI